MRAANVTAQEQLRGALLQQARSGRSGRLAGWRDAGLAALRQAAAIRAGGDLRDEAIAHLAGCDLQADGSLPLPPFSAISRQFDRFIPSTTAAAMTVHRVADGRSEGTLGPLPEGGSKRAFFDPSGRWVAVFADSGSVFLFEAATRELRGEWAGTRFSGFSEDGARLALDVPGKPPRVVETSTLRDVAALPDSITALSARISIDPRGLPTAIRSSLLAPDPQVVAMAVAARTGVDFWNWQTGAKITGFNTVTRPLSLFWEGDWFICGTAAGELRLTNLRQNRTVVLGMRNFYISSYALTPDHTLRAISSDDGSASLWQTDTAQLLVRSREIHPLAFSPDGRRFLHGDGLGSGWGEVQQPAAVRYHSTRFLGHDDRALTDISPDGRWLSVCGLKGLAIFELSTGRLVFARKLEVGLAGLFTADSRRIVLAQKAGLALHELTLGDGRFDLRLIRDLTPEGAQQIDTPWMSANRRWLGASFDSRRAGLIDAGDFAQWTWLPSAAGASCVVPSPDGRWVAAGAEESDGSLRVWDRERPEQPKLLEPGNRQPSFSPDGRFLAVAGFSRVRIYETGAWRVVQELPNESHITHLPDYAVWSPDSRLFAFLKQKSIVCLFDTATWQPVAQLANQTDDPISHLSFAPDGRTLVVSPEAGGIEIWDLTKLATELAALGLPWELPPPGQLAPPGLLGPVQPFELPPLFPGGATK